MGGVLQAFAHEGGALVLELASQGIDHAYDFDAGLPSKKFSDVLVHDGFGARNFTLAGAAILLDDESQVVNVVEVEVVETGGSGIHIAGQAEIHDEERAVAPCGHGPFEHSALERGLFRGNAGNNHVGQGQCGIPVFPGDDFAGKFACEEFGAFARSIHNVEMGDATIAELGDDLFADGARAQDEGGVLSELAENAFGEFDAGGRDGHGTSAEFRFGANALADFESALEHAVEHRAGGAGLVGEAIGFADLAKNFGFAEDHGIEPGSHAEKVTDGVAIVMMVERAVEQIELDGVEIAEIAGESGGGLMGGFGRNAVNFAAVAGGEDQRFVEDAAGAELFGGLASLLGGEGHTLADLNWGRAVIQTDEHNFHGADWVLPYHSGFVSTNPETLSLRVCKYDFCQFEVCKYRPRTPETLKIAVHVREKQVHHGKAENHNGEIKNAQPRGA